MNSIEKLCDQDGIFMVQIRHAIEEEKDPDHRKKQISY